jgi:hypothetical protein
MNTTLHTRSCAKDPASGTAGSIRAARNDTPERSAIVHGWATIPATLTGAPWRIAAEGTPGTLTAIRSALSSPMTRSWTT